MRSWLWALWAVLVISGPLAFAAAAAPAGEAVTLEGRPVLTVGASPALTAAERAGILARRLEGLLAAPAEPVWVIDEAEGGVRLVASGQTFLTVTAEDLVLNEAAGGAELARRWRDRLVAAMALAKHERSFHYMLTASGIALGATLVAAVLGWLSTALFRRVKRSLRAPESTLVGRLFGWMNHVPYLSGIDVRPALEAINLWVVWLARLAIFNGWLLVTLGLFPLTRPFNDLLTRSLLASLGSLGAAVIGYLPNLVTIGVTLVATRYAIRLIGFVFSQMRQRPDELGFGLPIELIDALGKLATAVAWVFGAMVIAPLLPGLGTQTGQMIGLLVGAMITLGSGSTIGNAVAGFVLTYMRPFDVGDRVRIGLVEGDVLERNFTSVKLRTIKNEVVTLTSNQVLNSAITNYTTEVSRAGGLLLPTTITLGYDVPRRQAEALLLEAARRTDGLASSPAPFVLVTGLGDFAISYELNVATPYPHAKAVLFSELHKHVIDAFGEAGVEILSPAYHALRDGHHTTIGRDHVPPDYVPGAFRVETVGPAATAAASAERPAEQSPPPAPDVAELVLRQYGSHPHYRGG